MAEQLREGDDLQKQGVKFDNGKFQWNQWFGIPFFELIPIEGVKAVAVILGIGAKKYAPRNWEQGMAWSRPFDATVRHLNAWWGGEDKDPDTGKSHLWHAACNIFFLIAYEARGKGTDDRPK
jgi:hypothetical protein